MIKNTEIKYSTIQGKIKSRKAAKLLVPEARDAMNRFKQSVASDLGIDFSEGYKGNFSSSICGKVGGEMVRRIIEQAKLEMLNSYGNRLQ